MADDHCSQRPHQDLAAGESSWQEIRASSKPRASLVAATGPCWCLGAARLAAGARRMLWCVLGVSCPCRHCRRRRRCCAAHKPAIAAAAAAAATAVSFFLSFFHPSFHPFLLSVLRRLSRRACPSIWASLCAASLRQTHPGCACSTRMTQLPPSAGWWRLPSGPPRRPPSAGECMHTPRAPSVLQPAAHHLH